MDYVIATYFTPPFHDYAVCFDYAAATLVAFDDKMLFIAASYAP